MNNQELYEPSLSQESIRLTKTYNIWNLVYVAFFGGVIALTVLATRNGRWLNVKPKILKAMAIVATVIFAGKMILYYAYFHHLLVIEKQYLRYLTRVLELLLYGVYLLILRKPFRQHLVVNGDIEPLTKDAVGWCFLSMVIEIGLIFLLILI